MGAHVTDPYYSVRYLSDQYCYLLLVWTGWYWSDKYLMLCVQFWTPDDRRKNRLKHVEHLTEVNKLHYELIYQLNAVEYLFCTFSSTCFGLTRPSSGAMDVKITYTAYGVLGVVRCWSWWLCVLVACCSSRPTPNYTKDTICCICNFNIHCSWRWECKPETWRAESTQ